MSTPPQKAQFPYFVILILLLWPLIAQAKINVVATLPDFGSLAREIGKDKIEIVVLGKPNDDPHFVQPRPDFVASLHSADVLIDGGAGLELSWLPPLLQKARNPKLDIGKPGRVQASRGIRLMNIPTGVRRGSGEAHPNGNPHFTVDPVIAKAVAQRIAKSFMEVDPPNAAFYDANYKKFETTIDAKLQWWRGALQLFQDQRVVAYHDSWPYFAHRFGLKIDIFLEPRPGTAPSPSHLTEVIQKMKRDRVKLILVEPYQDRRIAEKVARAADAAVVDFSQFPGGIPGTDNYVGLINQLVKQLADALK
ncbi:MAG: zinc ABC transporter substrate-binding protein [Verrucomicrobia bacterium]|nr:zinc ABC transporter substrate-binding protein [Verrucomicrobiota bacterium]